MSDISHSFKKKDVQTKKDVKKASGSDQSVSGKARIYAEDLEPNLLSRVTEKLLSKQRATNEELLKYRMLNSSRKQYTDTVKECANGLALIESLKSSDSSSRERCTEAILKSTNKTLASTFEEAVEEHELAKCAEYYAKWARNASEKAGKDKPFGVESILKGKKWGWDRKDWNWEDQSGIDMRVFFLARSWYDAEVRFGRAMKKASGFLDQRVRLHFEAKGKEIVKRSREAHDFVVDAVAMFKEAQNDLLPQNKETIADLRAYVRGFNDYVKDLRNTTKDLERLAKNLESAIDDAKDSQSAIGEFDKALENASGLLSQHVGKKFEADGEEIIKRREEAHSRLNVSDLGTWFLGDLCNATKDLKRLITDLKSAIEDAKANQSAIDIRLYSDSEKVSLETNTQREAIIPTGIESIMITTSTEQSSRILEAKVVAQELSSSKQLNVYVRLPKYVCAYRFNVPPRDGSTGSFDIYRPGLMPTCHPIPANAQQIHLEHRYRDGEFRGTFLSTSPWRLPKYKKSPRTNQQD